MAPKSNASYVAISEAMEDVQNKKSQDVPNHLRDGHYSGAGKMGHGEGYLYSHSHPEALNSQTYIDQNKSYYRPVNSGLEKQFAVILENLRSSRQKA